MHLPGTHVRLFFPAFALGAAALEYLIGRLSRRDDHDAGESAASFGIAIGRRLLTLVEGGLLAAPYAFVYEHRLFHFASTSLPALALLFVGSEFLYYWHHRVSHVVRWFWATHSVHHTATRMNVTAAVRLGWFGNLTGNFLFFLPLVWLGFPPAAVLGMLAANLVYQFFLHTEVIRRLGFLEWVLNTPAHHRVHHAANASCVDRNFGGVLIVFDRMFGTFAPAPLDEPLRYGLVGKERTVNPVTILFGEWGAMLRDFAAAPGWRGRLAALTGSPISPSRERSPAPSLRLHETTAP